MAQNQKTEAVPARADAVVEMDSRKFLSALNDSAQAKIALMDARVAEMGRHAGKNWRLAGLRPADIFIEDVDAGAYYTARHRREKGGRIVIEGVTPIKIVESQKAGLFLESCTSLVRAIDDGDQRGTAVAFNKMASQRFSGRAIPFNGRVRTRDGKVRSVSVATNESIDRGDRDRLIAAIVEGLKDRVVVRDGVVVEGHFQDGKPLKLPINKWSLHKMVARRMREAAAGAYTSEGFQNRVHELAELIHEDKVQEAVKAAAAFLAENQEFTLLNRVQVGRLIGDTLAARAVFNQKLCEDTASLFYRTNLQVNRKTIVKEWRSVGKAAQHATLLENVSILEQSKNFESTLEKFLNHIFEAISDREVTAEALATTLEVLRDRTPKIKESHELASKLNDLIGRLKEKEFDDNAIYEAEDFIATVQEELATGDDLRDFDTMPGDAPMDDAEDMGQEAGADIADTLDAEQSGSTPSVVFNAPLISIGGEAGDALAGALGGDGQEEDEDLSGMGAGAGQEQGQEQDDLLAAGTQSGQQGGGLPGMESRAALDAISEEWDEDKYGAAPWKKDADEDDSDDESDPDDEVSESADPYAYSRSGRPLGHDYGSPALTNHQDVVLVAEAMERLAAKRGLVGARLAEHINDLAVAGLSATGIRVPERKLSTAVAQVISYFTENCGVDKNRNGLDDCEEGIPGIDHDEDEDPAEDQFKWGTTRRKDGNRRGSLGNREAKSEGIVWAKPQKDAVLGEMAGVKFIFDHGGANESIKPAILSEDGSLEIPIPAELYDSAFAAARMLENVDPAPFTKWLMEGPLDQLGSYGDDSGEDDMNDPQAGGDVDPEGDTTYEVEEPQDDYGDDLEQVGVDDTGLEDEPDDMGGLEDDALDDGMGDMEGAVVRVKATAGGLEVEVTPGTGAGGAISGMDDGLDDGMAPVDSVVTGGEEDFDEFGDTDGEEDEFADQTDEEDPADDFGGGEEDQEFGEDNDVTDPQSSKYTAEVNGNKRAVSKAKLPSDAGEELDGFGKKPKQADKNGAAPGSPK